MAEVAEALDESDILERILEGESMLHTLGDKYDEFMTDLEFKLYDPELALEDQQTILASMNVAKHKFLAIVTQIQKSVGQYRELLKTTFGYSHEVIEQKLDLKSKLEIDEVLGEGNVDQSLEEQRGEKTTATKAAEA